MRSWSWSLIFELIDVKRSKINIKDLPKGSWSLIFDLDLDPSDLSMRSFSCKPYYTEPLQIYWHKLWNQGPSEDEQSSGTNKLASRGVKMLDFRIVSYLWINISLCFKLVYMKSSFFFLILNDLYLTIFYVDLWLRKRSKIMILILDLYLNKRSLKRSYIKIT